ncbi:MAG: glycosyltransferase [Candidatus Uhrbacteria bacterium]|nr:glycosyltransferase [Patescibacteria group bacterium]
MKLALVHDHLIQAGGAEKVLSVFQDVWPDAPTYTLLYDEERMGREFPKDKILTSFLQKLPFALTRYQWYLPLMPTATERHDLTDFNVVLSSSSAFSKGIITDPHAVHVCYCHTPTRYLWSDTHRYLDELSVPGIIKKLLPPVMTQLRMWDKAAADRVDEFVANSETVRRRIKKYYGRDSVVIAPPVETNSFAISAEPKNYFLIGGRLVAYKRYDIAIDAFTKLGLPLKVFGSGPVEAELKARAGKNVEFFGRVSDETKAQLYAGCIAFLHPHEEDFGITQVEAMASGRPVIAYRRGGATEVIDEGVTGEFIDEQSWEELADRVMHFDESRYDPALIRSHALQYDTAIFKQKMKEFITDQWEQHAHSY